MKYNHAMITLASEWSDISYFMHLIGQMVCDMAQIAGYDKRLFRAVELGVRSGNSTMAILDGLWMAGNGTLVSCDIDECEVAKLYAESSLMDRRWVFFQCDSVQLASKVTNESIDFIFVDTSHECNQTRKEIEAWTPKVRRGGRVLFHDTCSSPDGVLKPIQEFLATQPEGAWAFYNIDVCCGLGVLRRVQ